MLVTAKQVLLQTVMTQYMTFLQGLHCLLTSEKEIQYFLVNPSIYAIGHPD